MGDKKALDRFKRFRKVKLAVQEAMWKDIAQFQEYDAMFDAVEASFEYPWGKTLKRRYGEVSRDTILL